jgi:hypothetical protein
MLEHAPIGGKGGAWPPGGGETETDRSTETTIATKTIDTGGACRSLLPRGQRLTAPTSKILADLSERNGGCFPYCLYSGTHRHPWGVERGPETSVVVPYHVIAADTILIKHIIEAIDDHEIENGIRTAILIRFRPQGLIIAGLVGVDGSLCCRSKHVTGVWINPGSRSWGILHGPRSR